MVAVHARSSEQDLAHVTADELDRLSEAQSVELFTEELGVVHRGEDRVCLTGGVRSDRLEQSWRGGHVEAFGRLEVFGIVYLDER